MNDIAVALAKEFTRIYRPRSTDLPLPLPKVEMPIHLPQLRRRNCAPQAALDRLKGRLARLFAAQASDSDRSDR